MEHSKEWYLAALQTQFLENALRNMRDDEHDDPPDWADIDNITFFQLGSGINRASHFVRR